MNIYDFTYHIVDIKLIGVQSNLIEGILFTYHIVDIKPYSYISNPLSAYALHTT
ncbi:Uncharacterised protein [Clostridioides difficile]|nr:Uncharacterised protein [Clostridioides difficile]SJO25301.1 Uncharacterised protein [Clostridioides difficile]SJO45565.1 Uncharacterised protein [Clostridioides difficile]SJO46993.1 Uncharacterised protein [Clostridioides difficile]SJO59518.1 Uncharacterised protein [Clostridioides difficile]